jgi:hypothetical protein
MFNKLFISLKVTPTIQNVGSLIFLDINLNDATYPVYIEMRTAVYVCYPTTFKPDINRKIID